MNYIKRKTGLFVVMSAVWLAGGAGVSAKSLTLYVSPDGLSDNSGSKKKPLASIADARDVIRKEISKGLKGDVTVWVRGDRACVDIGFVTHRTLGITTMATVKIPIGEEPL